MQNNIKMHQRQTKQKTNRKVCRNSFSNFEVEFLEKGFIIHMNETNEF